MESPIIDFRQNRNFMDTITAIFEFLRSALKPYFKAVTAIAGPYIAVAAIATGVYYRDITDIAVIIFEERGMDDMLLPLVVMYAALIIASMLLLAITYSFLRFSQREGRYPELAEVREEMRGTLGMVIVSSLLIFLIEIPAFLFLIVPGIWIAVPLAMVIPIRYNEGLSFSDAVSRAFKLVRDRWWWTFGVMVLCYFAQSIAASIFSIPATLITMFTTISAGEGGEPSLIIQLIAGTLGAVSQLASFYFSSVVAVSTAALYYNHVERLDATHLTDRVSDLAGGSPR